MKLYPTFSGPLGLLLGLALAGATVVRAADPEPVYYPQLTPPELEQLLGPIALYPDPLIALILPASTTPADVVLSARYLSAGGDPTQINGQPWSDSIKALARYPAIIRWMDENLQWTRELGNAVLNQPAAVMDAVQRLRARARASGALVSTPQQEVLVENEIISIVPAEPEVVYVPYYDPAVVYTGGGAGYYYPYDPYLTFGVGFPVGIWLSYYPDWHDHVIVVGGHHHNWKERHEWYRHPEPGTPHRDRYGDNWHAWKTPAVHAAPSRPDPYRTPLGISRPKPFPGAPSYPSNPHARDSGHSQPNSGGRDSDHNRSPTPAPGTLPPGQDHHGYGQMPAPPPPSSQPVTGSSPVPAPRPTGQPYQPHLQAPGPTSGPTVSHDSHDRGPATPSPAPRPDTFSSPANQPRASAPPGTPSSSVMSSRTPVPSLPPSSGMNRPPPSNPAPRPAAPPPPAPATNSKDSSRDVQPGESR